MQPGNRILEEAVSLIIGMRAKLPGNPAHSTLSGERGTLSNGEMLLGEITLNIIFDLGGVLFTWEPEAIIAKVFADPGSAGQSAYGSLRACRLARPRPRTLDRQEAIVRAAERMGLSVRDLTDLMQQVPPALVAIPGTVDLLYRLKAQGHKL